ncbi:hypothetical protein QTN25_005601 [Entamoeba marina]
MKIICLVLFVVCGFALMDDVSLETDLEILLLDDLTKKDYDKAHEIHKRNYKEGKELYEGGLKRIKSLSKKARKGLSTLDKDQKNAPYFKP